MSKKSRARIGRAKQQSEVKQQSSSSFSFPRKWIIALILGVTFLAFANTLWNGFAYDDTTFILQNQLVQNSSVGEAISKLPVLFTKELWFYRVLQDKDPNKDTGPTTSYYRPMFSLFQVICWLLFQTWAPGWHLANIIVHMAVVYFAFLIIEKITNDTKLSAIASLLFAIHPLRVESVAWICGISDPYLALFLLPSFYLYMLYREKSNINHLIGSVSLFLLATFTKEPAIALPIFIFAYEVFIINRERSLVGRIKPAVVFTAIFLLMSVCYFAMRYHALGFVLSDSRYVSYPFHQVIMTIPLVICKYIGLLLWPVNLSIFHATPIVKSPLSLRFIIPLVAVAAVAFALWQLRKNLVARFAILWFGVHLLPVLNLSAFGEEFLVQERYVYISSIGFSLLLAMALVKIPLEKWFALGSRRTAQAALIGLIALLLTGKTLAQNATWKDDITMWEYGAEVASDQAMPHFILGHKYLNSSNLDKAIGELERFTEINPYNLIALNNLAAAHLLAYETQYIYDRAHADRAHVDRAIALSQQGLAINESSVSLWDTLGKAYTYDTSLKNLDRAIVFFDRGLRVQPENPMLNFHMGAALVSQQKYDNALPWLERASKQAEIPDIYKFMAMAHQGKGQFQEAINYYNEYLKRLPNAADAATIGQQLKNLRAQLNSASPQS